MVRLKGFMPSLTKSPVYISCLHNVLTLLYATMDQICTAVSVEWFIDSCKHSECFGMCKACASASGEVYNVCSIYLLCSWYMLYAHVHQIYTGVSMDWCAHKYERPGRSHTCTAHTLACVRVHTICSVHLLCSWCMHTVICMHMSHMHWSVHGNIFTQM